MCVVLVVWCVVCGFCGVWCGVVCFVVFVWFVLFCDVWCGLFCGVCVARWGWLWGLRSGLSLVEVWMVRAGLVVGPRCARLVHVRLVLRGGVASRHVATGGRRAAPPSASYKGLLIFPL